MGILSTLTNKIDKFIDKIFSPETDVMMIGVPRYDNLIKRSNKISMAKASISIDNAMGNKVKKIDQNKLFKEISTIIEFYRFLYGVGGNVKISNSLWGFSFRFVCKSTDFLKPLYLELDRIFGDLYVDIQYSDQISLKDDIDSWLSVTILAQ